jgi:Mycothiol maleylpyruvate isomerase N-terminal domain
MSTPTVMKPQLLEALRQGEKEILDKLTKLPADAFERGRYENGWNGRQILAHIASIERSYPHLIAVARGDLPMPEPAGTDQRSTEQPYRPSMAGPIHAYNQRQVDKLTDASAAELLALFGNNRAATIAAVQATDDALFEKEVRTTGGLQGPLGQVLERVAVDHVSGHVNDIVSAA